MLRSPVPSAERARLRARLAALVEHEELDLPLLPGGAAQVLSVCRGSATDVRELAAAIQNDVAMSGHVLRVANSAAFAPQEPIVSLAQAVSRLGIANVRDIAVAVAARSRVFRVDGFEERAARIWRHCALAGAWAREIARLRRRGVESSFLAGLLHDVGRPVVLQAAVDIAAREGRALAADEAEELMREFHAGVGALLLARWNMPPALVITTRCHHAPDGAPRFVEDVAGVALADVLAHAMETGMGPSDEEALRSLPALAVLGLYADDLEELLARTARVAEAAETFS